MQTIVSIIETPGRPEAARRLRSTLRNWYASEVMRNIYRVDLTHYRRVTLAQVARQEGARVRIQEPTPTPAKLSALVPA